MRHSAEGSPPVVAGGTRVWSTHRSTAEPGDQGDGARVVDRVFNGSAERLVAHLLEDRGLRIRSCGNRPHDREGKWMFSLWLQIWWPIQAVTCGRLRSLVAGFLRLRNPAARLAFFSVITADYAELPLLQSWNHVIVKSPMSRWRLTPELSNPALRRQKRPTAQSFRSPHWSCDLAGGMAFVRLGS